VGTISLDVNTDVAILNTLDKKIRRYTFASKMEMFRKINHAKFNLSSRKDFSRELFPNKDDRFYKKMIEVIHSHELAYLSLRSVVVGDWGGYKKELSDYKDFRDIVNKYKEYVPPFIHKGDQIDDNALHLFMVRTALQQFHHQINPTLSLYRYSQLFNNENKDFNTKGVFRSIFNYDYEDYITFASLICIYSNNCTETMKIHNLKSELLKFQTFDHEKVDHMLNQLSMSRENALKKYAEYKSDDKRMKIYDYNPLLMKPIIKDGDTIFLPIPMYLFKEITEGFYHMLCYQSEGFRQLFGKYAFEDYIEHIFALKGVKYIREFPYTKQNLLSPDFILIENNDIILVEVKANSPSIKLRYSNLETYKKELFKAHVKAIEQCIKKTEDIRNGKLIHPKLPREINRISYLVVTLEEYYFTDHKLITSMLKEKGLELNGINYHIMGTPTLEGILERDSRSIFKFCHDREDEQTVYNHFADTQIIENKSISETRSSKMWQGLLEEVGKELLTQK
jgi:hypothetical protein